MELVTHEQTITDPAEWDGSLFGTQLELVQLAGGEFRSRQSVTELRGVQILRLKMNQPITVRSRPLTLRYVATTFDRSHAGHYAGAAIEGGRLLIMPPAFDFDACVSNSGFHCSSIFVEPEHLRCYYQTLVGEEIREINSLTIARKKPLPPNGSQIGIGWLHQTASRRLRDNSVITCKSRFAMRH